MAMSGFPSRKSAGAGGMTSPADAMLDTPPPSPAFAQAPPPTPGQQPEMPSFDQLAPPATPGTPGRAVSPEILMGLLSSMQTVEGIFDSAAGILPDLATDFALLKELLNRTVGKMVVHNGQGASPSAVGSQFPGGGFLGGQAPAA